MNIFFVYVEGGVSLPASISTRKLTINFYDVSCSTARTVSTDSEESWLLTPADMTSAQRGLLSSLPEHLIGKKTVRKQ